MGQTTQIVPNLMNSQEFIYVYKTVIRSKKGQEYEEDENLKTEGTRINFKEFIEVMVKIASIGRSKFEG